MDKVSQTGIVRMIFSDTPMRSWAILMSTQLFPNLECIATGPLHMGLKIERAQARMNRKSLCCYVVV